MHIIDVLVATHNGEKYLETQLNSILDQSYKNINIIISDDNSSDNSISILQKYEKNFDNVTVYKNNFGNSNDNFWFLLQKSTAPFIAYADQDDFWLPKKLEISMEHLLKSKTSLVYSDVTIVDEDLKRIGSLYKLRNKTPYVGTFSLELLLNPSCQGCTMLFSSEAKKFIDPFVKNGHFHDSKTAIAASKVDGISFIDEELVLYRQHSANQVGSNVRKKYSIEKLNAKSIIKNELIALSTSDPKMNSYIRKCVYSKIYISPSICKILFANLEMKDKVLNILFLHFFSIYVYIYKKNIRRNR